MWQGVLVGSLVDMMPIEVRTSGWSFAYSLTYAVFDGITPVLVTYLIHLTGEKAIPRFALTNAAIVGLCGTLFARKYQNKSCASRLHRLVLGAIVAIPAHVAARVST